MCGVLNKHSARTLRSYVQVLNLFIVEIKINTKTKFHFDPRLRFFYLKKKLIYFVLDISFINIVSSVHIIVVLHCSVHDIH